MSLEEWGWSGALPAAPVGKPYALARVIEEQRGGYFVMSARGERWAELSGRLAHETLARLELPGVGDWVWIYPDEPGLALIHGICPRRNHLARLDPNGSQEQLLAANIDLALLVTSVNQEFSAPRLERYSAMVRSTVSRIVVILSKADLAANMGPFEVSAQEAVPDAEVLAISAHTGAGLDRIKALLNTGVTAVLLGSSGVGKSTLLNCLLPTPTQSTQPIRTEDAKGRHVTTSRSLFRISTGALLIDSPGLRQVALTDDTHSLQQTFSDITALAGECRFRDCAHNDEPGCAVTSALASGVLSSRRYKNYLKLQKEQTFLRRQQNPGSARDYKQKNKKIHKQLKEHYKNNPNRKRHNGRS